MSSSLTIEDKIRRIIYKNNVGHTYFSGNSDHYQKDLCELRQSTINSSIENELKEVFSVLDEANTDKNLPQRSIMFLFLGRLMHYEKMTPELKSKVTAKVLSLCQSDEDFFDFIKYYTELRVNCKLPSSVEKAVRKFYSKKTPEELAKSFAKFNSLHKWTHKDLIKLAHVKPETPLKNSVIKYILKKQPDDKATEEDKPILDIVKKAYELRSTTEAVNAILLLSELKLTISQVSPSLRQNKEVWEAAIENMTIQEILPCLEKLYKLGLLKPNTTTSNILTDLFTSSEKVKASGIHPMEVFIYMKRLEKGGKPIDGYLLHYLEKEKKLSEEELKKAKTRTGAKCSHILNALHKCFNLACNNVSPTKKRYLITIEVTESVKNALCIGTKALTFLEAAVAYALILLRVEKDVTIAVLKEDKIIIINVEKKTSFSDLLAKVKSEKSSYSSLSAPIDWATTEKKHIDVFVTFLHNYFVIPFNKEHGGPVNLEPLKKYRKKMNVSNSKLIMIFPNGPSSVAYYDHKEDVVNVLDITGFDVFACKTAECFSRDKFC